jgi:hypothetical protein
MKVKFQYYKITPVRKEYLGIRYFKFEPNVQEVIQVCYTPGDTKKGRSNTPGITVISSITFFSNYLTAGYCTLCSKAEYDKHFDTVVKLLKGGKE